MSRGYELGTHTRMHQLVYEQTPAEFEKDLAYSIKTLENITGKKVKYFRAPGFSITENEKWAFEILIKHGIEVDCSIFPAPRAHGGFKTYKQPVPSIIKYNGIRLKELPINYFSFLGYPVIYSGGGYFRLFPYSLIKQWTEKSEYVMSYLHPRDFDPDQPIVKELSMIRRYKSYVGLRSSYQKLEKWLTDFNFIDIKSAISNIKWESVPLVEI